MKIIKTQNIMRDKIAKRLLEKSKVSNPIADQEMILPAGDVAENQNLDFLETHEKNVNRDSSHHYLESKDKIFLSASTLEIVLGLLLIYLPYIPLLPIIPSILIGTGFATFVYQFMGGIKQDDSIVIGGAKLTGTLASLITIAGLINTVLEAQTGAIPVSSDPDKSDVLVLSQEDGEPTELNVKNPSHKAIFTIPKAAEPVTNDFKNISVIKMNCWSAKGICKEGFKPVKFYVDKSLKESSAAVCEEYYDKLQQLPMIITAESKITAESNFGEIGRVKIESPRTSRDCFHHLAPKSTTLMPLYISRLTANQIGINTKVQQAFGRAKIASLRESPLLRNPSQESKSSR